MTDTDRKATDASPSYRMPIEERAPLKAKLKGILARGGTKGRKACRRFTRGFGENPTPHALIANSEDYSMYSSPSRHVPLLPLRLAMRHTPDDLEGVWSPLREPAFPLVSTC